MHSHQTSPLRSHRFLLASRALLLFVLLVAGSLMGSSPANAHAKLEGTVPANGSTLAVAPEKVSVVFSQPVGLSLGSVRVYNADAQRADDGNPVHSQSSPSTAELTLNDLAPGPYVITWRVTSADGHPIRGASVFRVGEGDQKEGQALAEQLLAADGGSVAVGAAFAVVRWLVFATLLLGVGSLFFLAFVADLGSRARRFTQVSFAILALASASEFALQGARVSGLGLRSVVDPELWSSTIDGRYGQAALVRAALSLLLIGLLAILARRAPLRALAVGGAAVIASLSLAGHATTGRWPYLAFGLDVIHVAAACAWIGGLGLLVYVALRLDGEKLGLRQTAVLNFSNLALYCVILLGVTGTAQGFRQVGSFDSLFDNTYGILLCIKVLVFAALVAVASASRRLLRRWSSADQADLLPVGRLRKQVGFELLLAAVVLGVTSLLVNAEPPRDATRVAGESFYSEVAVGENIAAVSIDPAAQGVNQVHIYMINQAGSPTGVQDGTFTMSLPSQDIEAIPVAIQHLTPDHFASYTFDIPISGRWLASLTIRTSDVDQETVQFDVPIS